MPNATTTNAPYPPLQTTRVVKQPALHMHGWPECRYHGPAKTDGTIWWWEEQMEDGSVKKHPLMPYDYPVSNGQSGDAAE